MSQHGQNVSKTVEGPLNDREVSLTVGLLHRAVAHGQSPKVIEVFRKSLVPKQYMAPASDLVLELTRQFAEGNNETVSLGAMTDGAKRRLTSEDASPRSSEWDQVSMTPDDEVHARLLACVENHIKKGGYVTGDPKVLSHVNKNVKLPDGLTLVKWGETLCTMEKVKDRKMTYVELLKASNQDTDLRRYLTWIKSKFGTGGTGDVKVKYTAAVDLALFMEATEWPSHPAHGSDAAQSEASFVRTFKS